MKLKHFFLGIVLATTCTFIATSCGDDDYSPVSLVSTTEEYDPIGDNNTLTLSPFTSGESFYIRGGNGAYIIDNKDKEIVHCDYDGRILTLIPQKMGTANIVIKDYVGNSYTLTVSIEYPTQTFEVKEVTSTVNAPNMKGKDEEELMDAIINQSPVQEGGKYVFTYHNKELSGGSVTIYPTQSGLTSTGIFQQTQKYTEDTGTPYMDIQITLPNNEKHNLMLMPYNTAARNSEPAPMALKEDVTDQYKTTYPDLEKAYLILLNHHQPLQSKR